MVETGYLNLPAGEKHAEWDILNDLMLQGANVTAVRMDAFLAIGRNTILGRKFDFWSERGERGQIATESYARTLRNLIKEGYIKAWIHQPAKQTEGI